MNKLEFKKVVRMIVQSYQVKKYAHICITFALMFFIRFIPPIDCITPLGMEILGIFIGTMYGWIFCGLIWPSLMALIMIGFSDYSTVGEILSNAVGHQTVVFVLFLYIFCGVLEEAGISLAIGQRIANLKFAQGKPYILLSLLCFGAWLMGGLVSTVGSILIFWQIFSNICTQTNYNKNDLFPKLGTIGILCSSVLGSTIFLFKLYPIIMMGIYSSITGETIDFIKFMVSTSVVTLLLITVYLLFCKFILRPKTINDYVELKKPEKFTSIQLKMMGILIVLIFMFMIPSIFPANWWITKIISALGQNGTLVAILIMCFIISDKGKPLIDIKNAINKGMSWEIYFLLFAIFQLSDVMASDSTGILDFIIKQMGGILGDKSPIIFCFLIIAIGGILSNVISNGVTPMIMIPLVVSYSAAIGINPEVLLILLTIIMYNGIIFPSGSAFAGLLLANEWIETIDVYKYGTLFVFISIIIALFIGVPLVSVIMI